MYNGDEASKRSGGHTTFDAFASVCLKPSETLAVVWKLKRLSPRKLTKPRGLLPAGKQTHIYMMIFHTVGQHVLANSSDRA